MGAWELAREVCAISCFILTLVSAYVGWNLWRKLPRRVNCWFCQEHCKVPHGETNSFVCPACKQYNGFEEDGGYNKAIPEQYDEMLNPRLNSSKTEQNKKPAMNGLCKICNNNQQLKVYQLANFVPMAEDNYDKEIEHFQEQLEKAYKLCPKCDKVLTKTIYKQNKWTLGLKIKHLRQKGASYFKLNDSTLEKLSNQQKSHLIFTLLSFAFLALVGLYMNGHFHKSSLTIENSTNNISTRFSSYLNGCSEHVFIVTLTNYTLPYYKFIRENTPADLQILSVISMAALILPVLYVIFTSKTATIPKEQKDYKFITKSRRERILQESYSDNEVLKSSLHLTDVSTDTEDSDNEIIKKFSKTKKKSTPRKYRDLPVFGEKANFEKSSFTDLNDSFATFSSFNDSFVKARGNDLNVSLSKLKLGGPLIAPARLKNPWTGSYWDADTLSRSSSQSSGFCSYADNNFYSLPGSGSNSICGEFECSSVISEPVKTNWSRWNETNPFCNVTSNNNRVIPVNMTFCTSSDKLSTLNPRNVPLRSFNSQRTSNLNPSQVKLFNSQSPSNFSSRNIISGNRFNPISNPSTMVDSLSNKFKPLNVNLDKSILIDNRSVHSCSTLQPGSIYSTRKSPPLKPLFADNVHDSSMTSVYSLDFSTGQYNPRS